MGCSGSKPLIGCSDIKPLFACSDSKLDRLPAVSLCRDRCKYLDHALRHSYALADAHMAYAQSLGTFGATLKRFVDGTLQPSDPPINGHHPKPQTESPKTKNPPNHSSSSRSSSDSHIHFHSDSEDDNIDTNNTKIINDINNNHHHHHNNNNNNNNDSNNNNNFLSSYDGNQNDYYNPESLTSIFDNFMQIRHMQKQPTRSLSYIHQPAYETHYNLSVHTATESEPNEIFPLSHYSAPEKARPPPPPPPPPPPQPSDSTWDFLNFFDAYELPAVETTHEKKFVRRRNDREELLVGTEQKQSVVGVFDGSEEIEKRSLSLIHAVGRSLSLERSRRELEDESKKKEDKMVNSEVRFDVAEVMREVDAMFQRASDSGNEILKLLDVGRYRYYHRNGVYQVKAKILHAIAAAPPAIAVVSPQPQSCMEVSIDRDSEGMIIFSGNVSSALKKLCMWEKKLKNEVKAEEKLCKIHARKCKELKQLINKGADANKVDSTQNYIKTLSTQLKVALHVIDKISITINKLRDEELWPQINALIFSFLEMWKAMHECHKNQYQAIARSKSLDAIASSWKLDNSNIESIMQLRLELQNWNLTFCNYVYRQNCFLKALNGWLMRCILQDPIDTPDGLAPFSPTRIDAPPAFVITNRWLQTVQRISEKEVTNSMQGFSGAVNQMFELQRHNLQQGEVARNEVAQRVRILVQREQKLQSVILDQERKIADEKETAALLPGRMAPGSEIDSKISLQLGLQHIFEALERYSQECVQAYKELSAFAEGYDPV